MILKRPQRNCPERSLETDVERRMEEIDCKRQSDRQCFYSWTSPDGKVLQHCLLPHAASTHVSVYIVYSNIFAPQFCSACEIPQHCSATLHSYFRIYHPREYATMDIIPSY